MNTEPETLAAIIAEIRREAGAQTNPSPLYRFADRIEASAERERVKARRDAEIEWTRIGYEERKAEERPGNAAAMRAALEGVTHALCYLCVCGGECESGEGERCAKVKAARAALSAPARNCDRFDEYHDAVDAWHREERCLGRHQDGGTCEKDPLASTLAPVCFARWLFAPAKGGAE